VEHGGREVSDNIVSKLRLLTVVQGET